MTSTDIIKLIDEYKNSNIKQQAMLEKKYGKRQMQTIQKYLTTEYLQDNAKRCPKCRSFISKTEGCNKMTCRNCQSFFCWLCNNQIHGYEHFNTVDSPCYGLLFEGLETENAMDYENAVDNFIMDNINQYLENFNV
ncbi:E3 ubiquitin-protein ligase RNF14-like [Temnothorax curvispinosus]|uniref:RBR-type E3 ubiquitin transferase n=1 Tax=Temnothorax curvispinosus TaxID=300111 RepID=A0A6J1Q762_9HYME|nr:E3 ubiquitin-protein ligase RNF14-like [Temnothorax curvispinosus]